MRRLFLTLFGLLISLSLGSLGLAQKKTQKTLEVEDHRFDSARSITDDLIKDTSTLDLSDRALLWMRLAEAWRKVDPKRSRSWLKRAVVEIEFVPDGETSTNRGRRLAIARGLLPLAAFLDKDLSARLTDLFIDQPTAGEQVNSENAIALVKAAAAVVDTDPKRAAALLSLGSVSLRSSKVSEDLSSALVGVIVRLRKRDATLADGFFSEMLSAANLTHDKTLLTSLLWAAFIAPQEPQCVRCSPPPDSLRSSLLTVVLESVRQASLAGANLTDCNFLSWTVAPLLNQYDRLVPTQAISVRQELNKCQSLQEASNRQPVAPESGQAQTIDELVDAANNISNQNVRATTLARIAGRAARQKKFDRAIEILESIGSDMPDFMRGMSQAFCAEWAAMAALEHLKKGDQVRMQMLINSVPPSLRPNTELLIAEQLNGSTERTLAVGLLMDAQKRLASDDVENQNKAAWYPLAVRLSAKYIPSEAPGLLNEAIKVMNRVEFARKSSESSSEALPSTIANYHMWEPLDLAVPVLQIDELGVRYAVGTIESPRLRAQVRLGLLFTSIEQASSNASRKI